MNIHEVIKEAQKDLRRKNPPKIIEVPEWVRGSFMNVRREALPSRHPQSYYNYIKNELGLEPEEYGIFFEARNHQGDKVATKIGILRKIEKQETIGFFKHEKYGFGKCINIDDEYFLRLNKENGVEIWKKESLEK